MLPMGTAPESVYYRVFAFKVAELTEYFVRIVIYIMLSTVSAVLFLHWFLLLARMKFSPSLSVTAATINGKVISMSPITMILRASFLSFPQLTVSSRVEPESPPVSGLSMVRTMA